jgi:hypothetical protein
MSTSLSPIERGVGVGLLAAVLPASRWSDALSRAAGSLASWEAPFSAHTGHDLEAHFVRHFGQIRPLGYWKLSQICGR